MPLDQVASLSIPESRLITVKPWDQTIIGEIEKAILKSDLGLTPVNDGKIIRIPIPPLTEQRRKDLAKMAKKFGEEGININYIYGSALPKGKKALFVFCPEDIDLAAGIFKEQSEN